MKARITCHTRPPKLRNFVHVIVHVQDETDDVPHILYSITATMSRKAQATDQIVKLIVGAGQASPSPPVGPALGSKGVKSMDFCKVSSNTNPP